MLSEGKIIAAVVRQGRFDELGYDRGPWSGRTELCHSCERETIEHLEDMVCWQCHHPGELRGTGRSRSEILKERAAHLRRRGFPDEARRAEAQIEAEQDV
jgi:hypothetical protein